MVASLRCWSPDGRGENTPTSCSFGSWNVERSGELWKNHMLVRYEDLKQDQEGMLRKIANFTGFALTEDQIQVLKIDGQMTWEFFKFQRLNEHMKFDNYQKSSSLNKNKNWWVNLEIILRPYWKPRHEGKGQFIRKGIVGDWMNHFTPELNKVTVLFSFLKFSFMRDKLEIIQKSHFQEYNCWIRENLDRIGVNDETVRSYFTLEVKF